MHKSDCPLKDNPYLDGCLCSYDEEFETFREFKNALDYLGYELTVVEKKDKNDNEEK